VLLTLSLLFVPACTREKESAREIVEELLLLYPEEQAIAAVYGKKELSSLLPDLYGKDVALVVPSIEDFAVCLAQNDSGFEIHVFKMRHLSEAQDGETLLRGRKELLQSAAMRRYHGERYDLYLSSAVIYRKDRYVFLLVAGENNRAIGKIKEIL
jgi:hypothetical protein